MLAVSSALKLNGYPEAMIRTSQIRPVPRAEPSPEWRAFTVLPYVRGVSESLRRILTSLRVRVCFRPHRTLRQLLSKPKDPVPELQRSGVVYRVPCAACPASYVGQTGRRLCQRMEEHRRAVRAADFNTSALAEHAWSAGHPVDWEGTSVLTSCPEHHSRLVHEAILIRTTDHTLNRDSGVLPPEYMSLL